MMPDTTQRIAFHFQPYNDVKSEHLVEKDENGKKRRYLRGVSSGLAVDGHGERMTDECIKGFMNQANSGDVLLYPDLHGVRGTDDIGIMTKANITPEGDWMTEYRLYDEEDGVGAHTLERADKMWKQLKGLPPYTKPRQKGFSIEGNIPDGGIAQMAQGGKRVINQVDLDGVVIVPRPAYKTSIAHAVYKALGEQSPWAVAKAIAGRMRSQIMENEIKDMYYRKRYMVDDALGEEIKSVMCDPANMDKANQLNTVFDEYKQIMIELILASEAVFQPDEQNAQVSGGVALARSMPTKMQLYKSLYDNLKQYSDLKMNKR